jgi:hypothetical protein
MSDTDDDILATAEELRAATELLSARRPTARAEVIEEWLSLFRKRAPKTFKDAASKGLYKITVDLPYQPRSAGDRAALRSWKQELKRMLPGCHLTFLEEEDDAGCREYTLEISWEK